MSLGRMNASHCGDCVEGREDEISSSTRWLGFCSLVSPAVEMWQFQTRPTNKANEGKHHSITFMNNQSL